MIGVLCPTRDRPKEFKRFCSSVHRTAPSAVVLTYIDDDQADLYADCLAGVQAISGPRCGFVASLNALVSAFPNYSAYALGNDDAIITTPGWDRWLERILDSFPGRIGVVSAHNNEHNWCNFPAVSREWVTICGHFAWPMCKHYAFDTIFQLLGEMTQIVYAKRHEMNFVHEEWDSTDKLERIKQDAITFLIWSVEHRLAVAKALNERRALCLQS